MRMYLRNKKTGQKFEVDIFKILGHSDEERKNFELKIEESWEEELEDIWGNWVEEGYNLNRYDIIDLLIQYLGKKDCEVKIKVRKGKMVIEKI